MSAKANLVLLVVAGLFLAALASRNGSLAMMALPFLLYLLAGLLASPKDIRLGATRSVSSLRAQPGESITVTLAIQNEGSSVPRLEILEQTRSGMLIREGSLEQRLTLPSEKTAELRYTFQGPRGMYAWETIPVIVSDLFGLFEQRLDLPAQAQTLILPEQIPLRRMFIQPLHTLCTVGPNLSRLPGIGVDFWGVREYRPGDSLRWIHWRNSARHPQQFFTKEFEREEMANIGLLLDARATTNLLRGERNLLEYSTQAAAALARSLLRAGNRVSLLIVGERMVRVFPGTGKPQLARILDRLAECEPSEKLSFDALKYIPVRLFPTNSLIIMISPLRLDDDQSIARLRAEGYQVLLVSPDPIQFCASEYPRNDTSSLAIRAARLERAALLWRIRQMGVAVVDWPVDQPLSKYAREMRRAVYGMTRWNR